MGLWEAFRREWIFVTALKRTMDAVKHVGPDSEVITPDDFEDSVRRYSDRPALIFHDDTWTYGQMDAYANQVARWAQSVGLKRGDTVALFAQNRIEYIPVWFGLAKVGIVTALINNQLSGQGLAHCLRISGAHHVIADKDLITPLRAAQGNEGSLALWSLDGMTDVAQDFQAAVSVHSGSPVDRSLREGLTGKDVVLKMYTSGTTGLPKAASITHIRCQNYLNAFGPSVKAKASDRVMMVLPLYHATGGLCGVGMALMNGGAVVLSQKFSASRFWEEATRHGATLFMYVGELCRFLVNTPPGEAEKHHTLRAAVGNGLRPDIWQRFKARFGIRQIVEFYGATEGNVGLINFDGKPGAVGRVPPWAPKKKTNVMVVKHDVEAEQPLRGPDGLCIRAEDNEVGELLGEIRQDDPRFRFDGYEGNDDATRKKILSDVMVKGDRWFTTGDLLRMDKHGYLYFVDRIGDTFRWKSENVATSEVAEAAGVFEGVEQANVYGVEVPGMEGRAGMVALVVGPGFDLDKFHTHMRGELPAFARPVFLRMITAENASATGTFKQRKVELKKEGFDPKAISDPLYFDHPDTGSFIPLDAALYERITTGAIRL